MKYNYIFKPGFWLFFLLPVVFALSPAVSIAGPPYDTDDPEPVGLRNWEIYLSSHSNYNRTLAEGTLPHFEVNYGIAKNVQLHLMVPLAFNGDYSGKNNYGIGDIEVGVKFRFIQETKYVPQVGIFPLVEIPTGNSSKELGSGHLQVLLPVWLQKSFGEKWKMYGGYGLWINPGSGNKNWSFVGLQAQYQALKKVNFGCEIYYTTPDVVGGTADARFNIGSVIDINDQNHILLSAGRSFTNNTTFQCYIGYLFTISKKGAGAGINNFRSPGHFS